MESKSGLSLKKIGAELILAPIFVGIIFWFSNFVLSSYSVQAEVSNMKDNLTEIKEDTKAIKQKQDRIMEILIEMKNSR